MEPLTPFGPEGIRSRMEAIRGRMREAGMVKEPSFSMPVGAPGTLTGEIGPTGATGFSPMNPMSPGLTVGGQGGEALKGLIQKAAQSNNLDPHLFDALVQTESAYDVGARSKAGAMGLTQLMPGTARDLGVEDPFNPEQNLMGGAKYLSSLLRKYNDPKLALAAYNAGPGAVDKHGGIPPYKETRNYVDRIMSLYARKAA